MGKKGVKAAYTALQPVVATARQDEDHLFVQMSSLPEDPLDARLTLAGAVVGEDGKLDTSAYDDLQSAFAGEPPPNRHPVPGRPGVRTGDEVPKGLRIWDDLRAGGETAKKDGAGWIASFSAKREDKKKEKWFNIRTTGSWRMAFLLARLQRQLWEAGGRQQGAAAPSARTGTAAPTAAAAATAAAGDGEASTPLSKRVRIVGKSPQTKPPPWVTQANEAGPCATPTKKRPQIASAAKPTARKQARKAPAKAPKAPAQPAVPAAFAGSERFAALMAARKAQQA